jgi:autotransporter-associated beta strand protein
MMMYGYVDAGSGGPLTINFSGLPAAIGPIYDVYVYVAGDMGTSGAQVRTGDYTIGKTTILATQGSSTSAYTLAGNGTAGNYIEFPGVSGSSFSLEAAASSSRAPVDGIQIVQASAQPLCWTGSQGSEWSTNVVSGSKNWQVAGAGAADYTNCAATTFDDSAATTIVDISATDVVPSSVTFSNAVKSYTLQSNEGFGIAGTSGLSKSGGGLLAISNTNKFTGPVTFGGGTVAVAFVANSGVDSPLGAGASLVFDGGTLEYSGMDSTPATNRSVTLNSGGGTIQVDNGATAPALDAAISGLGSLAKAGLGGLILSGANTYDGGTLVNAGTLVLASSTALAEGASLAVGAGAAMIFDASSDARSAIAASPGGAAAAPEPGTLALLSAAAILAGLHAAYCLFKFRRSAA